MFVLIDPSQTVMYAISKRQPCVILTSRGIITENNVSLFLLYVHQWIRFSSLTELEVVKMTAFSAAGDGRF